MAEPPDSNELLTLGLQDVLKVHLLEYQKVFDTILQLRDHQYRLTNYGLIAIGALLAAAASLYTRSGELPEIFWGIVFGGFLLFSILTWQQVYVDRTMFRLDYYLMRFLQPAVREVLSTLVYPNETSAEQVFRYEDYFFGLIQERKGAGIPGGSLTDLLYGISRYAVPLFGSIATFLALGAKVMLGVAGIPEAMEPWVAGWGWLALVGGLVILGVMGLSFINLTRELQRLRRRCKP